MIGPHIAILSCDWSGPVLSLQLTNATAGLFTCEAAVPGFPAITQAARLRLRGPPRILLDHGTQFR